MAATETTTRLCAESVTVRFEGVVALREVEFDLADSEIVGLIGPNGAGKTTLVNVLSGFVIPAEGSVALGAEEITGRSAAERARRGLGRTFQNVRPFPSFSVRENIEVAALGSGASSRQARQRAAEILRAMALDQDGEREADSLPAGDERRLGIARALAIEPRFLLLDEPAAGLNEFEGVELVETLREIREERGIGIAVIDHDISLIMTLCDRVQVLDHGQTIARGTPDQVQADPQVIEAYLGAAPEAASA